jgi:hypothetical protein
VNLLRNAPWSALMLPSTACCLLAAAAAGCWLLSMQLRLVLAAFYCSQLGSLCSSDSLLFLLGKH